MNKNKLKYNSIPQDSFKYEIRRLDSEQDQLRPLSTINYDARINELCLSSTENEKKWSRYKSIYSKIELITFIIGLLCSITCLALSIYSLYFTKLSDVLQLISSWSVFKHPYFYFVIEGFSFVLDLIKLVSIIIVFRILSSKLTPKPDETCGIEDTIYELNRRYSIREKLRIALPIFCKLEILLNSYHILIVIALKYALAIYIGVNYKSIIDFKENLNCTQSGDMNDCVNNTTTYLTNLIIFLYTSASLKLLTQTCLVINFKYFLSYCLAKRLYVEDFDILKEYNLCKEMIFKNDIKTVIERRREDHEEKNFNFVKNYPKDNEQRYLNDDVFNDRRYLNDDEIESFQAIDKSTNFKK